MNKHLMSGACVLALCAGAASAGGLDRSGQSVSAIFAPDGTVTSSVGIVMPDVTGSDVVGGGSYDVGETYTQTSLSWTNSINEKFSYSVIFDQPFGADVSYDDSPLTSALGGTGADLNSAAINFVGRVRLGDRFSVFGGVAAQRLNAKVDLNGTAYASAISTAAVTRRFNASIASTPLPSLSAEALGAAAAAARSGDLSGVAQLSTTYALLPTTNPGGVGADLVNTLGSTIPAFLAAGGYSFEMENSTKPNYFIGAAYEIPEIALRIAGTYRFETEHTADTTETLFGITTPGSVTYKTPASFNLEAQTGVAEGTLVTFGYRWTDFSAVNLVPMVLGSDLVNLDDSHRYSLGVAKRFNEKLAASATLIYEPEGSDLVSPLGPTNGLFGVSLGAQYTDGNMKLSGGINYSSVGDAIAEVGGRGVTNFTDNHVIGVGFKAEFTF